MGFEEWKDVPGYEGLYQVSNRGRVRSLDRRVSFASRWGTRGSMRFKGKMLALIPDKGKYFYVTFTQGQDQRQNFYVHQLVLLAFVGPCPVGMLCCHENGNGLDNNLSNLRWDTQASNCQDTIRHGRRGREVFAELRGERQHLAKLTEAKVLTMRERFSSGEKLTALADEYGVDVSTASSAVNRQTWKHVKQRKV